MWYIILLIMNQPIEVEESWRQTLREVVLGSWSSQVLYGQNHMCCASI
jgi:hypothetical protein